VTQWGRRPKECRRRGLRRRWQQLGQAMVEYSVITATVVAAFAIAYQLGFSDVFINKLNDASRVWNVELPSSFNCSSLSNCSKTAKDIGQSTQDFNRYINLR
jgi:hypothetical protein